MSLRLYTYLWIKTKSIQTQYLQFKEPPTHHYHFCITTETDSKSVWIFYKVYVNDFISFELSKQDFDTSATIIYWV